MGDPNPVRVSVVAIMRNEGENLPGLIGCVQPWADELVLVDDSSTDGSAEIALRRSSNWARIVKAEGEHPDGFAGLRNLGIEAASGDWIVHVDCDERITPALAHEILASIQNARLNALRYVRRNYFLHRPMKGGGWQHWNRPQIARKGYHRFEGRLHERCVVDGGHRAIGQLKNEMLHLNDRDFSQRLRKSAQYVEMDAGRVAATGIRVGARHLLGKPTREFVKRYVLQGGFRDGVPGLIAAFHSATAVFRTYALVWDRQNTIARDELERSIAADWDERPSGGEVFLGE